MFTYEREPKSSYSTSPGVDEFMPTCYKVQWALIGATKMPRAPQPHHHQYPTPHNPTTNGSSRLVLSTQRGTFNMDRLCVDVCTNRPAVETSNCT